MWKKFFCLLLSLIIVMGIAGCSGTGEKKPESGPDTSSEEPPSQEEPSQEPVEEPAEEPKEEPAEEPKEEPAEEPKEEPAEEPKEEPAEEPKEEPAEEPKEEPAEEPKEEPAEEPKEEPAEEPKEEPADIPAEEPDLEKMTKQELYQYNRSVAEAKSLALMASEPINGDKSSVEPYPLIKEYKPDMRADNNSLKLKERNFFIDSSAARQFGVYIGKNDFYFYRDTIEDFQGKNLFSEEELARKLKTFQKQYDYCKNNGISYYLTFAPNKNSIYPEYMPENYTEAEYKRIDQLTDYIRNNSEIPVIELRDVLISAKNASPETDLYHRLDTHWNQHAGFLAVNELLKEIQKTYPAVTLLDIKDYRIDYMPTYMKDQAWYMGYYDTFIQEAPQYTPLQGWKAELTYVDDTSFGEFSFSYTWPNGYHDGNYACSFTNAEKSDAPSLVMFRDSFGIAMIHFAAESFSTSSFFWSDYSQSKIRELKPDIVIVEIAERSLAS